MQTNIYGTYSTRLVPTYASVKRRAQRELAHREIIAALQSHWTPTSKSSSLPCARKFGVASEFVHRFTAASAPNTNALIQQKHTHSCSIVLYMYASRFHFIRINFRRVIFHRRHRCKIVLSMRTRKLSKLLACRKMQRRRVVVVVVAAAAAVSRCSSIRLRLVSHACHVVARASNAHALVCCRWKVGFVPIVGEMQRWLHIHTYIMCACGGMQCTHVTRVGRGLALTVSHGWRVEKMSWFMVYLNIGIELLLPNKKNVENVLGIIKSLDKLVLLKIRIKCQCILSDFSYVLHLDNTYEKSESIQ